MLSVPYVLSEGLNSNTTSNFFPEKMEKHYCDLFNCVRRYSFRRDANDNKEDVKLCSQVVYDVYRILKDNGACGMDNKCAEHLLK